MKVRFWFILLWCLLWISPLWAESDSAVDLIEHFNSGQINWTRGLVMANGTMSPQDAEFMEPNQQGTEMAFQRAVRNVYKTLLQLRIDDRRCGASFFGDDRKISAKIEDMAAASKVLHIDKSPSGNGTIYVQMSLYGGFAQFVLPPDIRQVQPILPLKSDTDRKANRKLPADTPPDEKAEFEGYTGLIVDARGTGAKPSMVPSLVDENGAEVFGPAYVSREYAVQYGVCQYIRLKNNDWSVLPRVAPKPLVVKGLKTDPPESCRIVISNFDASKLRGASSHLEFLKRCRVIIVLD